MLDDHLTDMNIEASVAMAKCPARINIGRPRQWRLFGMVRQLYRLLRTRNWIKEGPSWYRRAELKSTHYYTREVLKARLVAFNL